MSDKSTLLDVQIESQISRAEKAIKPVDENLYNQIIKMNELLEFNNYSGLFDMPKEEAYHNGVGISRSMILDARKTPLHFAYRNLWQYEQKEATQAMELGDLVHRWTLNPETIWDNYDSDYSIMEELKSKNYKNPRNTNDYKAARKEVEEKGKTLLKTEIVEQARGIVDSLWKQDYVHQLLTSAYIENAGYAIDDKSGLLCRAKFDAIRPDGIIMDLKTSLDLDVSQFEKDLVNNGYFVQAALYANIAKAILGTDRTEFVIIGVEKEPPYEPAIYRIGEATIELGEVVVEHELNKIEECFRKKEWPGYPKHPIDIDVPHWAFQQIGFGYN